MQRSDAFNYCTLRWGNPKTCTDISGMCCFVSSLRIWWDFKQQKSGWQRSCSAVQKQKRCRKVFAFTSSSPRRLSEQVFPIWVWDLPPLGTWKITKQEGNAEQEKHPRHQCGSDPSRPAHMDPGKKPTREPPWESEHWLWRLVVDETTQILLWNPRGETQPGNDSPLG